MGIFDDIGLLFQNCADEAGYGMLSEAMIQPFVYRYKKT